ncbi:MAG: hypothetical protein HOE90_16500 [Bacteriovoracaceae bacterium]|jgi:hypothetical protein|nr:hypothetical protein [Bacteriovoracaceae bacterium]
MGRLSVTLVVLFLFNFSAFSRDSLQELKNCQNLYSEYRSLVYSEDDEMAMVFSGMAAAGGAIMVNGALVPEFVPANSSPQEMATLGVGLMVIGGSAIGIKALIKARRYGRMRRLIGEVVAAKNGDAGPFKLSEKTVLKLKRKEMTISLGNLHDQIWALGKDLCNGKFLFDKGMSNIGIEKPYKCDDLSSDKNYDCQGNVLRMYTNSVPSYRKFIKALAK